MCCQLYQLCAGAKNTTGISLAHAHSHTHTPPTYNHPPIHIHGYRSKGAPRLQTPPNLMCFHLTLLIHRTHVQTHMEAHAQVYEQTQLNVRFIQACTHTYGVQPPPPLFWKSSNIPPNLSAGYFLAQKTHHQYTGFLQLGTQRHKAHTQLLQINSFKDETHLI